MTLPTQTQPPPHPPAGSSSSVNSLIARLPRDVQQRLLADATRLSIHREDVLSEAGSRNAWTYLLCSGLASLQTMTEDGDSVEVAMVGSEGIIGLPFAGPDTLAQHRAVVVIPGEAMRVRSDVVHTEFERTPALQRTLLQYWYALMAEMTQASACHRFHTARQRLARWLLAASDRTNSSRIEMTQERLAQALGTQRTGVTAASVALQDAGAIRARHGRITIVDRRRIEAMACECYRLTRCG
jgi:CRP-like cAMP-binding protein